MGYKTKSYRAELLAAQQPAPGKSEQDAAKNEKSNTRGLALLTTLTDERSGSLKLLIDVRACRPEPMSSRLARRSAERCRARALCLPLRPSRARRRTHRDAGRVAGKVSRQGQGYFVRRGIAAMTGFRHRGGQVGALQRRKINAPAGGSTSTHAADEAVTTPSSHHHPMTRGRGPRYGPRRPAIVDISSDESRGSITNDSIVTRLRGGSPCPQPM